MRYKEFNNNKVLENCISLFWENGFSNTSINTLVHSTRVNRFSLYKEFESKQGILYEAMNLYRERHSLDLALHPEHSKGVIDILKTFFFRYLEIKPGRPAGCFIIYIATELGDNNEYVNSLLKTYLNEIETKFISLLNTDEKLAENSELIASNLILLFCNAMCYCHIQNEKESQEFISLNLDIILNN